MHCWFIACVLPFVAGIQPPQLQRCGYEHAETSAAGGTGTDMDPATVRLNNAPADRQAEPVAWWVRMCCVRFAEGWRENAFAISRPECRPIILHRGPQLPAP